MNSVAYSCWCRVSGSCHGPDLGVVYSCWCRVSGRCHGPDSARVFFRCGAQFVRGAQACVFCGGRRQWRSQALVLSATAGTYAECHSRA